MTITYYRTIEPNVHGKNATTTIFEILQISNAIGAYVCVVFMHTTRYQRSHAND